MLVICLTFKLTGVINNKTNNHIFDDVYSPSRVENNGSYVIKVIVASVTKSGHKINNINLLLSFLYRVFKYISFLCFYCLFDLDDRFKRK